MGHDTAEAPASDRTDFVPVRQTDARLDGEGTAFVLIPPTRTLPRGLAILTAWSPVEVGETFAE